MRHGRAYEISDALSAKSATICCRLRHAWAFASCTLLVAPLGCFEMEIPDYDDGDVVLPGPETPLTDVEVSDVGLSDAESDTLAPDIDSPDVLSQDSELRDTSVPAPDLAEVQAQVFQVSCSPCHTDRVSGALSLRPSDDLFASLLSSSVQQPAMPRVTPGDLSQSYLWLKVTGAHLEAGGLGESMPLGGTLSRLQIELLRRWIEESAANDDAVAP
jgi:hypothetical protein